jgi:hypothetical protein
MPCGPTSMHARCALALFTFRFAVCAASEKTTSASRVAWRSPRPSRATPPSRCWGLLPCHRTHLPMRHGFVSALRASVHLTPFLVPWKNLNTRPARALPATSHSLRVSRTSPAQAQLTAHTQPDTHRASCLLAAAPLPPTPPHPTWTAATPSFAHGWAVSACAPCRLQPARRRLEMNFLGAEFIFSLTAAARDGLELVF